MGLAIFWLSCIQSKTLHCSRTQDGYIWHVVWQTFNNTSLLSVCASLQEVKCKWYEPDSQVLVHMIDSLEHLTVKMTSWLASLCPSLTRLIRSCRWVSFCLGPPPPILTSAALVGPDATAPPPDNATPPPDSASPSRPNLSRANPTPPPISASPPPPLASPPPPLVTASPVSSPAAVSPSPQDPQPTSISPVAPSPSPSPGPEVPGVPSPALSSQPPTAAGPVPAGPIPAPPSLPLASPPPLTAPPPPVATSQSNSQQASLQSTNTVPQVIGKPPVHSWWKVSEGFLFVVDVSEDMHPLRTNKDMQVSCIHTISEGDLGWFGSPKSHGVCWGSSVTFPLSIFWWQCKISSKRWYMPSKMMTWCLPLSMSHEEKSGSNDYDYDYSIIISQQCMQALLLPDSRFLGTHAVCQCLYSRPFLTAYLPRLCHRHTIFIEPKAGLH